MTLAELTGRAQEALSPEQPVLVIGAANVDIVGKLKEELHLDTSNASQIRTSFGGVARNVAENLARLGQPVCLLTAVGDDPVGQQLLEQASSAGVDVSAAIQSSEHPTSSYLGVVNEHGKLHFALDDMRVMSALSPDYIRQNEHLFKQASLLFVDANVPKETLRVVMSIARREGLLVCADPTAAPLAPRFEKYLDRLFLFTPNSAEASVYHERPFNASNRREATAAAKLLVARGIKVAIITLAEFGVCYATSQTNGSIPAMRTQIVDPTGAGDAMTATVIFALLNGIPVDDAVRLAVTAASLTLGFSGTVVPDLTLEKLYDRLVI
jgi:pseudouridine kinase